MERAPKGSTSKHLPKLQPQQLQAAQPKLQLTLSSSSALERLASVPRRVVLRARRLRSCFREMRVNNYGQLVGVTFWNVPRRSIAFLRPQIAIVPARAGLLTALTLNRAATHQNRRPLPENYSNPRSAS